MEIDWETDREIDRETLIDFVEGVFENERSTSSDRRKGGPLIWTSFWTDGAQKPIVFKAFRRHKAPILEREQTQSTQPRFFLRNNRIFETRSDPIDAITLGDLGETFGASWDTKWRRTGRQTGRQREKERKRETDRETDKETDK